MEHILLQYSFQFKKRKPLNNPEGFYYDNGLGAWLSKLDASLLVKKPEFASSGTKKEDVETGEDLKGQ